MKKFAAIIAFSAIVLVGCTDSSIPTPMPSADASSETVSKADYNEMVLATCEAYEAGVSLEIIQNAAQSTGLPLSRDQVKTLVLGVCPTLNEVCDLRSKGYSAAQMAGESDVDYDTVASMYKICGS